MKTMSTVVNTVEITSLEQQLEKAKSNLKGLNSEIRRIVGRPIEDERYVESFLFFDYGLFKCCLDIFQ